MSKITRQGSNAILSTSVEYHNFVYPGRHHRR